MEIEPALRPLREYLEGVTARRGHRAVGGGDVLERQRLVEEVAHAVHEHLLRLPPAKRLVELRRDQLHPPRPPRPPRRGHPERPPRGGRPPPPGGPRPG